MNMLMIGAVLAQLLVRPWSQTNEPIADRVSADFKDKAHAEAFVHYAVPPMSGVQRLPDVYPYDGKAGGTVRIVLAKDEYEPGSFLVWGLKDLGKVQLELGEFRRDEGRGKGEEERGGVIFPKENLDLKVVKVWYQNRNGWYSYFGDTGFKLCPELLLNDEDLIRVDETKEANYARLRFDDGTVKERWINPPRQFERVFWESSSRCQSFQPMRKEFSDAETLQPVTVAKGAFKQFFLTVRATKDTPAGLYRGEIVLRASRLVPRAEGQSTKHEARGTILGKIPVEIKVLDFALPKPAPYADTEREFDVSAYPYNTLGMIMEQNGGDYELAKRQYRAQLVDMVAHGQTVSWIRGCSEAEIDDCWAMTKEAGMRTDTLLGGVEVLRKATPEEMASHARRAKTAAVRRFGPLKAHYIGHGDEPSHRWLVEQRPAYAAYQDAGFKFVLAGSDGVFLKAGYLYDWHNTSKAPEDDATTRLWNQLGSDARVAWYASMHTGPENPEFNRRQYGLAAYLSGYSAFCNYCYGIAPYNDDSTDYKPMVMAYGHYRGAIDTLQWEGFREGIDDIRYATLAVRLARKAAKSSDTRIRYEGNLVLHFLARFDKARGDMGECRLEMARRILRLKEMGVGE